MKSLRLLLASTTLMPLAQPGLAQQAPAPPATEQAVAPGQAEVPQSGEAPPAEDPTASDEEEIVVVGQRDPNAVIGDIPPENQLNSRDIRAYGAASVAELLEAIAPMTQSARGRESGPPVTLLNGRRISGFREIRDLPPEAILRVDILPEEVALKYGYRADQRVVNIILRPRFRSTAARLRGELPTEGGQSETEIDLTRLMIGENGRTTFNLNAENTSELTEDERDIAFDPTTGLTDPRPFRTLIGSGRELRAGTTVNRTLFGNVSSTFDGQLQWNDGRALLGPSLVDVGDPLIRDSETLSGHAGMAFNGDRGRWRWSLTGNYDVNRSKSRTDRESEALVPFEDQTRSLSRVGNLDFVANGPFAELPAGRANVTVRVGGDTRDLDSMARRSGLETETDLGRDRLAGQVNFDLPIAKRNVALSALGNLTLNANAEVERLSDFGTLTAVGAGAFWSPVKQLNLIGSWTREEGAPGLETLGAPVTVTPNSRVFDFRTGQTVLVDVVSGGNPELDADKRNVWKLGGTLRPSDKLDLEIRADYVRTRISDPVSRFPGPTAAIEAAFPDRFQRDSDGNLIRADFRPVNFARSERDELRWGFNFSKPLRTARPSQATLNQLREQFQRRVGSGGAPPPPPESGEPVRVRTEGGPPPGGGGGDFVFGGPGGGGGRGGGRFGGGGGPFGGRGGRLQLSAYHTVLFKDQVRIGPEGPVLDFLDGEAAEGGGGRARHRLDVDAGWFNNGLGVRLSANWQSASEVEGGPSGSLRFSPLAKFNLNAFANLGERLDLVTKHPWLRGTQVRVGVENIFDAKQCVRDAAGLTPINYQPDLLDPQGRTISISLRKLFLPPPRFFRRQQGGATPPRN